MSGQRHALSPSRPRPVPGSSSSDAFRDGSPADSASRATSTARLASSPAASNNPSSQTNPDNDPPLAGAGLNPSVVPGHSALATALQGSFGRSPPRFGTPTRLGTPPLRPLSPAAAGNALQGSEQPSTYGSFDTRSVQGVQGHASPAPHENAEIVKRHLVQSSKAGSSEDGLTSGRTSHKPSTSNLRRGKQSDQTGVGDDDFSSLQLQGGDVTREVYRWTEEAEAQSQTGRGKRSQSFHISRPEPDSEVLDISSIRIPGGFRRNFLRRQAPSSSQAQGRGDMAGPRGSESRIFTQNFIEFLTLYGHFAGEELEEDDEVLGPGEYFSSGEDNDEEFFQSDGDGEDEDRNEARALLTPSTRKRRRRKRKERGTTGGASPTNAALLLLKAFVGTGVLFLPKAYLNGGMLFSNFVMLGLAVLNTYCFILLGNTHEKIGGSFGDMGGALYGKYMRALILFSIVMSQIGFAATYIVFTAENLQAFIVAVSNCRMGLGTKLLVFAQLAVFLPLSLVRDLSKLGFTALVADVFIVLGLVYLSYSDIRTLVANHGVSDIVGFNPRDWSLLVGTAVFSFEGIGLIIPIKEAMVQPSKFPSVLAFVMIVITSLFVFMGTLSYAAFGSKTRTVVLLNLPQDDRLVNTVQLLYSIAILLSTPLQMFPAIRIAENELFTRSGKHHPYIKWKKNVFRFFLVTMCALLAWGGAADLDKFVALSGNFLCVPLVYIYPALLHLKAVAQSRTQKVADIVLCVVGIVVMVYTTTLTVQSWASGPGVRAPEYCDQ
ncbi:neutral amino acid transporter [Lobaria immixta]|nr:neutral amino acid transporter [Lobaria immixta]